MAVLKIGGGAALLFIALAKTLCIILDYHQSPPPSFQRPARLGIYTMKASVFSLRFTALTQFSQSHSSFSGHSFALSPKFQAVTYHCHNSALPMSLYSMIYDACRFDGDFTNILRFHYLQGRRQHLNGYFKYYFHMYRWKLYSEMHQGVFKEGRALSIVKCVPRSSL